MTRSSAYTFELRLFLCSSCGAPIEVPLDGGLVQCRYCSAQSQLAARSSLPAFAPPAVPRLPEHERLARLRAQVGRELLPPPSIDSLIGPGGVVRPERQTDAFVAWQSARKRTADQALDAAEELAFLNVVLSNQFLASGDWTRHRAMLESSFEAFFMPRHRSSVAADLCCGACREGDLQGAKLWLALCDPASDDLFADSNYRLARASVAFHDSDYPGMLEVLGQTAADVPVHDAHATAFAVHRAHALECMNRTDRAIDELSRCLASGTQARTTMANIVGNSGLCPRSYPAALAAAQRGDATRVAAAGRGASVAGASCLLLGVFGLLAGGGGILSGAFGHDFHEGPGMLLFLAAVVGFAFSFVGVILFAIAGAQRQEARRVTP